MAPLTVALAALGLVSSALASPAAKTYKHVAVFSVDGLHSSDLDKYVDARPKSTFAQLLNTGYYYPNANTSAPSDSYPGSLAAYTGATPRITGVWYDVTYDRSYYPIGDTKCTGQAGTEVASDESLDYNSTELFSGGINPANLVRHKVNGKCVPLYPHNRLRVNTAFEVIQAAGHETAYTDKHPAYDIMRGPSGKGLTVGYFPEIANITTTGPTAVDSTIAYDKLHAQAFLDWLDVKTPAHSEGKLTKIPTLFGGNFQSVSVAQKTVGYLTTAGSPLSPAIFKAMDFVDSTLGSVVAKLKSKGIFQDTLIIVASKHGQAPINRNLFNEVDPTLITNITKVPVTYQVSDDIALIFLNKSSDAETAVKNLEAAKHATGDKAKIFRVFSNTKNVGKPGGGLSLLKHGYGTAATDPAVPDILVAPEIGTIFTTSTKKVAEHGGISNDDRNVACFASNPSLKATTFNQHVLTTGVAPVILKALGYSPSMLQGVAKEGTPLLPGF